MPTKGKGIDSTFATQIAPKPSLSKTYDRTHMGADSSINKPADEGKIKMRTFCSDYPSLSTDRMEAIDSTFEQTLDVRYNPGGDTRPKASENLDSTFGTKIK
jgi:hypothetical protein